MKLESPKLEQNLSSAYNDNLRARQEELMRASESSLKDMSEAELDIVRSWFRDFPDTFALNSDSLGYTDIELVSIDTPNRKVPLYTRPYRIPYMYKKAADEQVQDLLNRGLIQESTSGWNSPAL